MSSKKAPQKKDPTPNADLFDKLMEASTVSRKKRRRKPEGLKGKLGVIGCCMPPIDKNGPKAAGPIPGPCFPTPPFPSAGLGAHVDTVESLRADMGRLRERMYAVEADAEGRRKSLEGAIDKLRAEKDAVQSELDRVRVAAYALLNLPEPKKDIVTPLLAGGACGVLGSALYFFGKKKGEEAAKSGKGKKGKPEKKTDYKKIMQAVKDVLAQVAITLGKTPNMDFSKILNDDMLKALIGKTP